MYQKAKCSMAYRSLATLLFVSFVMLGVHLRGFRTAFVVLLCRHHFSGLLCGSSLLYRSLRKSCSAHQCDKHNCHQQFFHKKLIFKDDLISQSYGGTLTHGVKGKLGVVKVLLLSKLIERCPCRRGFSLSRMILSGISPRIVSL